MCVCVCVCAYDIYSRGGASLIPSLSPVVNDLYNNVCTAHGTMRDVYKGMGRYAVSSPLPAQPYILLY